jgi:hypothetical protein
MQIRESLRWRVSDNPRGRMTGGSSTVPTCAGLYLSENVEAEPILAYALTTFTAELHQRLVPIILEMAGGDSSLGEWLEGDFVRGGG